MERGLVLLLSCNACNDVHIHALNQAALPSFAMTSMADKAIHTSADHLIEEFEFEYSQGCPQLGPWHQGQHLLHHRRRYQ